MILEQALQEFKAIYKEHYGKDISDEEATKLAVNLLALFNVIYRPLKKEWVEGVEPRKGQEVKE